MIGREKEIAIIIRLMTEKKNVVIFGKQGVGKTSIIQEVINNAGRGGILYSPQSRTLKETLINLLSSGHQRDKKMNKMNTLALKKNCYEVLNQNPGYIILDHLERIEPKHYSFLNYIIDKNIPLMVVSRSLKKEAIGHLRMSLFSFEKVEVCNLDRQAADMLTDSFIKELGIEIAKKDDFKKEIFKISGGNPRVIKQLCILAHDGKYRRNDSLDVYLMDLDRRIGEVIAK